jgi:DNA-directed RNA polymerase subunit H (RpoH/RPB5)
LSGLYRLRPDFEYYSEYPAKTALVWYTFNSGVEKHPGSQPKLPTEEAVKIINFYKTMAEAKIQIDIIITISNIPWSSAVIKEFEKDLKSKSLQFQFFLYHELMYNPTRHNFVPIHRKLKREEVIRLERDDGVSSRILAALLYVDALYRKSSKDNKRDPPTDPIVKWYDFRPGDIIEITGVNWINESDVPVVLRYRAVKYNIAPR